MTASAAEPGIKSPVRSPFLLVRLVRGRRIRLPHLVLAAFTIVTFAGPPTLLIVRGGPSEFWPPDRPVEWFVVVTVPLLAVSLMAACLTVGWWYPPERWKHDAAKALKPSNGNN